ncbi:MAG: hypothetical protein IPN20_03160, partial [Haliscomenobacter sp.]|nr:hypothetical protein [Haliscomenobacter sp.]
AFQPDFIKSHFTTEIQQTAIGREGEKDEVEGVAKKRSLRNYRVIKPDTTFEGLLETTASLLSEEDQFLQKAIRNLRYAGTRRNRGFGKVKCGVEKLATQAPINDKEEFSISSGKLEVTITTQSPVVLAEQLGEQNTVFTRKYISGNQLRGLLANAYIRETGLSTANAHLDPDFFELFLSGKVKFGSLSFSQAIPIPLHLHTYKQGKDKAPISVFDKTDEDNEITKLIGGAGAFDGEEIRTDGYTPKTSFNFHNSRYNRAAGRSTENDAETGIFYYESLNEGQTFHGEITGEPASIVKLAATLSKEFPAKLGRSRSAQYGSVLVKLETTKDTNTLTSLSAGKYVMTLQSPLILLNENGHPSPTVAALQKALSAVFESEITVEKGKAAAASTYVEQFNAIWQAKSDKIPAFKEGSSFIMTLPNMEDVPTKLGEWTEQGFGVLKFEPYPSGKIFEMYKPEQSKEPNAEGHHTANAQVLKNLIAAYEKEETLIKVKSNAIKDAQNAKHINNHLIGRLERLFERSGSKEDIFKWIKETQGKPAGDALRKADLVDHDHEFKIEANQEDLKDNMDLQKIYWTTFFQTLRKINKKNGRI